MAETALSIGERLRQERIRRGLSQTEVARELETTQQTIGRWEHGQTPQPRSRRRIEDFLRSPEPSVPRLLRLATGVPEEVEPPVLTAEQTSTMEAVWRRFETGVPLSPGETRTIQAMFQAVGLEWPA